MFLAYGFKDFCHHIQKIAKRKALIASIQLLVRRRHKIVHQGDLNAFGKLQTIQSALIKTRVMHVVKFVARADEFLKKSFLDNKSGRQ